MTRIVVVIIVILAAVAAALFWPSQSSAPTPSSDQPRVVATIPPVAMILEALGGQRLQVVTLLAPGASPHTYDPRPADVRTAQAATAMFYVDADLDGWATKLPAPAKVALFDLLPETQRLPYGEDGGCNHPEHQHDHDSTAGNHEGHEDHEVDHGDAEAHDHDHDHDHGHDHGHHHGEFDPHFWSDPLAVKDLVPVLRDKLIELDPAGAGVYRDNAAAFEAQLGALHQELQDQLLPLAGYSVFMFHPSMRYMTHRYGLVFGGSVEEFPGKEPTPQYLRELSAKLAGDGARALFIEPQLSPRVAETLAERLGIKVMTLDPIGGVEGRGTYADLMRFNAASLVEGLQ